MRVVAMTNDAYRMKLRRHIEEVRRSFGRYTPTEFDMSLFDDPTVPDRALYFATKLWRDVTDRNYRGRSENAGNSSGGRERYFVMFRDGDGGYKLIDRYDHGRVLATIRPGADRLAFIGAEKYITMLGGRGEFGQVIKMAEDFNVLKDHPFAQVKTPSSRLP